MKLVVTGASGFIGSALSARLLEDGHALTLLTRSAPPSASLNNKRWHHWTPGAAGEWEKAIDGCDGIINLAGEPIASKRWSAHRKEKISLSRLGATSALVDAIARGAARPKFLINASAVGFYGDRGDAIVTEESAAGHGFLSHVCQQWESEALKAERLGCRVVLLRTGIVLGPKGGALEQMLAPFRFFLGGSLGNGSQWMPWIHIEDEVGLIRFLMENEQARGPVNATAPNPVTNKEFSKALGKLLKRPCWLGVPAFALRGVLGEMADLLLSGQRVMPAAAARLDYQFRFPTLSTALENCLR